MDFFSHNTHEHQIFICPFCKVHLVVEMPRMPMEMVQIRCGRCGEISYCNPFTPMFQSILSPEYQMSSQGSFFSEYKRNQLMSPAVSSVSYEPTSPKTPFVVKPPEKKHRLPSNYNRFMREEIQRIKAAQPDIPHREAFSRAAKNWANPRNSPTVSSSSDLTVEQRPISLPIERGIGQKTESFDIFKQFDRKN